MYKRGDTWIIATFERVTAKMKCLIWSKGKLRNEGIS